MNERTRKVPEPATPEDLLTLYELVKRRAGRGLSDTERAPINSRIAELRTKIVLTPRDSRPALTQTIRELREKDYNGVFLLNAELSEARIENPIQGRRR